MGIKALIEKRNSLIDEQNSMLDKVESEVRGLTNDEEVRFNEIDTEIESIDKSIKKLEERAKNSDKEEEKIEENEERGIVVMDKEKELRGIEQYLRKQPGEELRAMNYSTNGHLVPEYLHNELVEKMDEVAPLFSMIPLLTPVAGTLRIARETNLGTAGFVGESTALTPADFVTDTVELKQHRAGSAVVLSQKLINDAGIDVVSYSNDLLFRRLGYALDRAMITGTGEDTIEGLVNAPETSKIAPAAVGVLAIDDLMKVASSMKAVYQSNAVWIMDRTKFQALAALKDGSGHFYVIREKKEIDERIAYKLFGLEIVINDAAQDIYLVNFAHAYKGMVKKEVGIKLIDSDNTNALAGTATLVLDAYVDAKIVQPEAIRVLTISAGA